MDIKTNRLKIYSSTKEQMEKFITVQSNHDLKVAYTEMLNGCINHPNQWDFYAIWMVELNDGTHIGEMCYKGLSKEGVTEIGYGISKKYRGYGYATEAVSALVDWAFSQCYVCRIEAETEESNIASIRVLEKCGFVRNGIVGEEGPRFVKSVEFGHKINDTKDIIKGICS